MPRTPKKLAKKPDDPVELPPHFLREWRIHFKLSLSELEDLLAGTEGAIRKPQLSKMENYKTEAPYNQKVITALAELYDVTPADLIGRPPWVVEDNWKIYQRYRTQISRKGRRQSSDN